MATIAPVIPLHGKEKRVDAALEPAPPEPAGLYCRVVIALFLHVPHEYCGLCVACGDEWPCEQVKRACFLIEAF
jgi:hypothetical protein